jgi:hypothetical protein
VGCRFIRAPGGCKDGESYVEQKGFESLRKFEIRQVLMAEVFAKVYATGPQGFYVGDYPSATAQGLKGGFLDLQIFKSTFKLC